MNSQLRHDGGEQNDQTFDGRIGWKMLYALRCVGDGAYPSKNALAIQVGPNGSQDYGYQIVYRCIKRGLLEVDPDHPEATPQGQGAVVRTEKGEACYNHFRNDE